MIRGLGSLHYADGGELKRLEHCVTRREQSLCLNGSTVFVRKAENAVLRGNILHNGMNGGGGWADRMLLENNDFTNAGAFPKTGRGQNVEQHERRNLAE